MSQYSPGYPNYPSEPYVEQRTSVMAVLSLVFSLICCPPGPAVLGTLFGVAALIVIANSNGRLVGRGLAIAGIIISLVVSAVWLGLSIGGGHLWAGYQREVATPLTEKFRALDTGDYTTFRTMLTPEANARITDADLDTFRSSYQAELGHVTGAPGTLIEFGKAAMGSADAFQAAQGRNDVFPLVMTFDKGSGVAWLQLDPAGRSSSKNNQQPQFSNVIISSPKGSKWTLWDPARLPPGSNPTTPALPDGSKPDAPTAPTPENPADAPADQPTETPAETPKPPSGG
ncbi:MAG TPA: hypothetical protein VD997_02790 [Phycisphaerales bacterium]|nr:hypothetical protein [Phycisphaerales bacterium]